jgi:HD superfamily phosphohydrolase
MLYHDSIYGRVEIEEAVLLDLLTSTAVQRLNGVMQHGITGLIGLTSPITRFEHCVGAMLLVRRLGADLPEQIAALLHDVSHTAFSHVIDYVLDDHDNQSYHDRMKESYLAGTDVPAVLARHGYDWRDFLDETAFPLLEQPAPALCADRLDYFLRDGQGMRLATAAQIARVLDDLVVADGRIAVTNQQTARWLAETYLQADQNSWANFREVGLYEVTAQAIRRALAVGALTEADFFLTDSEAWDKLHNCPDAELQRWLKLVNLETQFVWDEEAPTFRVSTKLRTLDPDVLVDGRLYPLSTLDEEYGRQRQAYLASKQGPWPMRVIQ